MITKYETNKQGDLILSTLDGSKVQFKQNNIEKKVTNKLFSSLKRAPKEIEGFIQNSDIDEKIKQKYFEFIFSILKERTNEYDLIIISEKLENSVIEDKYIFEFQLDYFLENAKKITFNSSILRKLNNDERKSFLEYAQDINLKENKEIVNKIKEFEITNFLKDEIERFENKNVLVLSNFDNELKIKTEYLYKFNVKNIDYISIY